MELTIEHTELLYEATEIFHLWYKKYYSDPPKFSDLLQINHIKIIDICEEFNYSESEITEKIIGLKQTYLKLLLES